ncbi:MAG TPA: hypothetical protein VFP72_04615, partial [Kineosporiaceae bacterium]|nr:hypothetical protein [Kineosporiaceae bacterium]
TTALARAFIDQTLHAAHAAHTAGPDLIPPDQLARIQDAHQTTWAGLTTLADPRAPQRPANNWSTLITEFVNQVNTTDPAGHLWSQLRHQLHGNQLRADTTWWADALEGSPQEPASLFDGGLPPDPMTTAPPTIPQAEPSASEPSPGQLPPAATPPTTLNAAPAQPAFPQVIPPRSTETGQADSPQFTPEEIAWLTRLADSPPQHQAPAPAPGTPHPGDTLVSDRDPAAPLSPPPTRDAESPTPQPVPQWVAPTHEPLVTSHPPQIGQALRAAVNERFRRVGIGSQDSPGKMLFRYWPMKTAAADEAASPASMDWAGQWRDTPTLAAVLPELLALATLPKQPAKTAGQASPSTDPYHAPRQDWGQTVLAAAWHHAVPAAPTPPGEHAHPDPEHAPARIAQRVVEILTPRGAAGQSHYRHGVLVTAALAQALLDQTLHATDTAPDLTPDQITTVHNVHKTTRDRLLKLTAPTATGRNSPTMWADLVSGFVTDITTSAGPQIWTALHNRLQQARPPQQPAPATLGTASSVPAVAATVAVPGRSVTTVRPASGPVAEQVRPQELIVGEHQEALRILTESPLEPPVRRQAADMLARWWVAGSGPAQREDRAAAPGGSAWSHTWRQGPGSAALASLMALSVLPPPSPQQAADGPGLAEVRDRLQKDLLQLLWRSAEVTTPAPATPGSSLAPAPARRSADVATGVVTDVAEAIAAAQAPLVGTSYDEAAVHATAALTLALLDQTLHAVQTAEPGLTPTVQQARRSVWETATALLDPAHVNHASPAAWGALARYFIARIVNRAGPHVWTYLDDHLHGGPPRPASPDQNSPRPGPLDQAPWLHAMLSGQHHTDSP